MNLESLGTRSFIVAVLWMHGRSTGEIANVVRWTPGQVRGFVTRHFEKARDHLTYHERLSILEEMKAHRRDGNRLRDEHFKPIPIVGKPAPKSKPLIALKRSWVNCLVVAYGIDDKDRRRAEISRCHIEHREMLGALPVHEGRLDLTNKTDRREARGIEIDVQKQVKAEIKARELRGDGLADRRGRQGAAGKDNVVRSSALEYLFEKRLLKDSASDGQGGKTSEEQRRQEAGMRLRKHIEGSRQSGLGAIDYERATMGSGGGPKISITAYQLECVYAVGGIRALLSDADYVMTEAVVDHDAFVWESAPAGGRARTGIFERLRYCLDVIAVHESLMDRPAFRARWGEELPRPDPDRRRRGDAAELAGAAAEFMEAAR